MKKYFEKHETIISISLIIVYILLNSYSLNTFGITSYKTTLINLILSISIIIFIIKNKLLDYYRLTSFPNPKKFIYFIPLLLLISVNIINGFNINNTISEIIFYMLSMICVGFIEEIIFRGFLFTWLSKNSVNTAILVSSVTFGMGHIVNLINGSGANVFSNLLQVVYATAVGFLFTIIFYKSKSLWPCIITHI